MKKKFVSLLLALTLVIGMVSPASAIGTDVTLPEAEEGVIKLDKDYGTEGTSVFDFGGETYTLNLNGHKLLGSVQNAANVTVENKVPTQVPVLDAGGAQVLDEDKNPVFETQDIDTPAYLLGAVGTYKNDVSKYAADGYDAKGAGVTKNEIFNNEDNTNFRIVIEVTPDEFGEGDRDESTTDMVDVFANDYVTVTVKVVGARYASADMTLTWDNNLFVDETMSWDLLPGWEGHGADDFGGYTSYRFTKAHDGDAYFKNGDVIGTFSMRALFVDEAIVKAYTDETYATATTQSSYCTFTVENEAHPAKVIGSWRKAKADSKTDPLEDSQLTDDVAHIILMDAMTGNVEAKEGLIYKAQPQDILNKSYNTSGFSALVGGQVPLGNDGEPSAKVQTVVYTKAAYDALASTEPAYGAKKVALASDADIQAENAGDYVLCYKISAPGYASVTGTKNINIAKQAVDLVWTAPTGFDSASFEGDYSSTGFTAPTATYTDLNNNQQTANVELTAGPNGSELKAVGLYHFAAQDETNYVFNNPTCDLKVKGLSINGWTLKATNSSATDWTNGVIWRDGEARPIGYLDVADDASFKLNEEDHKYYTTGESPAEVTNVVVKYEYSEGKYYQNDVHETPNDETSPLLHKAGDEIWTEIATTDGKTEVELGKYKLRMTVTADNYEKMVQIVNFEIKNPIFVIENLEYVAGYSIVLAYTNEAGVSFKYGSGANAVKMYDVAKFGYKYNNNNYGNGSANYINVFAIVVKGVADVSMVYASNEAPASLSLDDNYTNMMPTGSGYKGNKYVNDVNNKTEAVVDLDDVTAIQSIYNVNAENMKDMEVVLRADVNRDKMVDVNGDVAQALAFYLNPVA